MIGQNSNNRNVGTSTKDCDAGLPIAGRTGGSSTDSYQIIKTTNDGTLAGFPLFNNYGGVPYAGSNFNTFAVAGGAPPSQTFLGKTLSFAIDIDGQYNLNPILIYPGASGGGISFVLYREFSALYTYINALIPLNAFNPSSTDINDGLHGYWHNSVSQAIGNTLMQSYNRNNNLSCNLITGTYFLAAITDGATNINVGVAQIGFNEFVKIA